ncbi:hypothetical protein SUGI_0220610 [Cryptomeria japonica]|nr:hypothetical protein SUGI_0220610 [Cryptomeria japonica]
MGFHLHPMGLFFPVHLSSLPRDVEGFLRLATSGSAQNHATVLKIAHHFCLLACYFFATALYVLRVCGDGFVLVSPYLFRVTWVIFVGIVSTDCNFLSVSFAKQRLFAEFYFSVAHGTVLLAVT